MQEHTEKLVQLQKLDLERARLVGALRTLPSELAEARAALTAAERLAAEISDALSRKNPCAPGLSATSPVIARNPPASAPS